MTLRLIILAAALAASGSAARAETDPAARFYRANEAYDAGRFAAAADLYEELVRDGHVSAEVFYNAANAEFRQDKVGEAVLMYRRAWSLKPRDADIGANLQLAMQRTGAVQPPRTVVDHFFTELSRGEWTIVFNAAYWSLIAVIAVMIAAPASRRALKPVLYVLAAAAMLGGAGWLYWHRWLNSGEAVVIAKEQTALYEPRDGATPFFELPEGSLVIIEDAFDNWVKVRAAKDAGWIPSPVLRRVIPW